MSGIVVAVHGGVASVTIDNPGAANALTPAMFRELARVWRLVESDHSIRVCVISAAGDRHFCAGADVSAIGAGTLRASGETLVFTPRQAGVTKPVVLALTGAAVGAGMAFVTDADVVVASEGATLRDPHVAIGQVCGYAALRLTALIPPSEATYLTLTGTPMSAARAFQLGLVNEIHPTPAEARSAAAAAAAAIVAASPAAVAATLRLQHAIRTPSHEDEVFADAMRAIDAHATHPDAAEGPVARAERRPPRWAGVDGTGE